MRTARVLVNDHTAGFLREEAEGYIFEYLPEYLAANDTSPVSLTLPLSDTPYHSPVLFPFFDGLIPEGWLLEIARDNWKLNPRDRMGLLMACCRDCIGNISIIPQEPDNE
jgi:HipA N-terminal domain